MMEQDRNRFSLEATTLTRADSALGAFYSIENSTKGCIGGQFSRQSFTLHCMELRLCSVSVSDFF